MTASSFPVFSIPRVCGSNVASLALYGFLRSRGVLSFLFVDVFLRWLLLYHLMCLVSR